GVPGTNGIFTVRLGRSGSCLQGVLSGRNTEGASTHRTWTIQDDPRVGLKSSRGTSISSIGAGPWQRPLAPAPDRTDAIFSRLTQGGATVRINNNVSALNAWRN